MAQRKGLGKGLESLIPTGGKTSPVSSGAGGVQQVAVDAIQPNPRQPRIHFKEDELVDMLQWMKENAAKGFFINDLQRHPLAYHSIKWITKLFSKSYLVKNDAPLSVARGFTKKEWKQLLEWACIDDYSLQWKWAFRYLVTYCNGQ